MGAPIEKILVLAPAVVSQGETAKIFVGTTLGLLDLYFVLVTPSGRSIPPRFKKANGTASPITQIGGSGTVTSPLYEMSFIFDEEGSYHIYVYGTEAGASPAILEGGAHITCTEWATNMDVPVSNIDKQTTNISRLRTTIRRNEGGGGIL